MSSIFLLLYDGNRDVPMIKKVEKKKKKEWYDIAKIEGARF